MRWLAILSLAALSACTTTPGKSEPIEVAPQGECDAAPVQALVGERADSDLGLRVLRGTASRSLRWIPPRSAVTQDFRHDRANVVYGDDYTVERIFCG